MAEEDGLPLRQRFWAIFALVIAIVLAALDTNIVNVALPSIARDLDTTAGASIWVVNAYQFAVVVALIPLSSAGDIFGYRRIYSAGLAVAVIGSLGASFADSLPMLTAARFVSGLGGAGIMSVNMALIRIIYPRAKLGMGISVNAITVAVTSAAAPSVSAGILSVADWHWIFAVNIPLGLTAFLLTLRYLPKTEGSVARFDVLSAILSALAFGFLIGGLNGLGHGQAKWMVGVELAFALVIAVLLVRRQISLPVPLLAIDLFRNPAFALSSGAAILCFIGFTLSLVSLPFYFQYDLGRSYVEVCLLMTPWPLAVVLAAPLSGKLSDRFSAGWMGGIGLTCFSTGLILMALLPEGASTADIVWRMAVCGFGFGFFQTPNNRMLMSSAPKDRGGGASGVLASSRLLGQSTGSAFAALIFEFFATAANPTGEAALAALVAAAGCAALAAVVSMMRLVDFRAAKAGG